MSCRRPLPRASRARRANRFDYAAGSVGAKSGQTRKSAGRQRLALILFGAVFILLFVGFAIAQGIGQTTVPSGDAAIVKGVPDEIANVSEAEYKRAFAQQMAQAKLKQVPKPGEKKYEEVKEAALGELLDTIWIKGQAEELGISVTDKQVATKLGEIKKQSFKTKAAYQKFLKESRFTQEDVDQRLEVQLLSEQIQAVVSAAAPPASNSEIANYYNTEKASKFTTKASRTVRVIVNKEKAEIEKAQAALEADHSPAGWKKVAAKYSEDPTTKSKGGLQPGVSEEFVKGDLRDAIFNSATNELIGPVEYENNYLMLEVVELKPEQVKTLGEARSEISSTLTQEKQREFFSEFVAEYQSRWQSRTYCASDFLIENRCANYIGSGHPSNAPPACYEANPKGGTPAECPAPVAQVAPALPGSVTVVKPKGEPFPQRSRPEESAAAEEEGELPEATGEGGSTGATGAESAGE